MTIEQPLTVRQVAALYRVTPAAVNYWIRSGKLSASQPGGPGGKNYVTWDQLRRFDRGLPLYKRRLRGD